MTIRDFRCIVLIALFCCAQFIFLYSDAFMISAISVAGARLSGDDTIVKVSQLKKGTPYWSYFIVNPRACVENLSSVLEADISWGSRGQVLISVIEQTPAVQVLCTTSSGKEWRLADAHGNLIGKPSPDDKCPKMTLDEEIYPWMKADPKSVEAVMIVSSAVKENVGISLQDFYVNSRRQIEMAIKLLGKDAIVKFGTSDDAEYKARVLKELLRSLKAENKPVRYLDIRFSQPVIMPYNANASSKPFNEAIEEAVRGAEPKGREE